MEDPKQLPPHWIVFSYAPFQALHTTEAGFVCTLFMILIRLVIRRVIAGSFTKWWLDDWMTFGPLIIYIGLFVEISSMYQYLWVGVAPTKDVWKMYRHVEALQHLIVVEQLEIILIWWIKVIFLMMFHRMTKGYKSQILVLITSCYVAMSFILQEALYFGAWCTPFSKMWDPDMPCKPTPRNHLITNAVLNISSDFLILAIPVWYFKSLGIPWKQWVPLASMFAWGCTTIFCASYSKYNSLSDPIHIMWIPWYFCEASAAIISLCFPNLLSAINKYWFPIFNLARRGKRSPHGKAHLLTFEFGEEAKSVGRTRSSNELKALRTPLSNDSFEAATNNIEPMHPLPVYEVRPIHHLGSPKRDPGRQL